MRQIILLVSLMQIIGATSALAEPAGPPMPPPIIARVSEKPVSFDELPAPRTFVTRQKLKVGGESLAYTATAGETYITNMSGEPIARFFSFSYIKDGNDVSRPVIFTFNGGPGSASLWLHIGALGPKRVVLDQEVNPSNTPPFGLSVNAHSVLDVADLVFIDPVGTGFSHAVGNARDADFASVDADADSVARFIERWLSTHGRWNSPKYLVGESYGTARAALLPRALLGGPMYTSVMRGITVDGVILAGVALGSDKLADAPDLATLALPGLAATAWYHQKVERQGKSVGEWYEEVQKFGATEYARALVQQGMGDLDATQTNELALKLQAYTGLSAETWLRANLRIPTQAFAKQVVSDRGLEVGSYDSRYTLPLLASGGEPVADDAAMTRYVPGFVAAFNELLREHLRVDMPIPYMPINFVMNMTWSYSRTGVPEGQSFAVDLATAMRRTPALRVLVASGYYDLVTTPAGAKSQIERGGLPADRVTFKNYESGHMLYLGGTAQQFAEDVRAFVTSKR